MNLCCLQSERKLSVGDDVHLLSSNKKEENTFEKLAEASGTIVYEVLVGLEKGLRREVV